MYNIVHPSKGSTSTGNLLHALGKTRTVTMLHACCIQVCKPIEIIALMWHENIHLCSWSIQCNINTV